MYLIEKLVFFGLKLIWSFSGQKEKKQKSKKKKASAVSSVAYVHLTFLIFICREGRKADWLTVKSA